MTLIRTLALFVPVIAAFALWLWRRPGRREATGAFMAFAWNFWSLAAINAFAPLAGWWTFEAQGGLVRGTPAELLIGWALLWGPVATLLRLRLLPTVLIALWLDLLLMPACAPLVRLQDWLPGEAVALLVALVPSQLFATWTRDGRRVEARAGMQAITFVGLAATVAVVPLTAVMAQVLALLAVPGLSAVQEFARRGRGTPFPFDPPGRLVRSGPYRYVTNPMQCSCTLVLLAAGTVDPWFAVAGVVSAIYSAGFAEWHERLELRDRWPEWTEYRSAVRPWLPRWRPLDAAPATLYVAATCGACSTVARWFAARAPVALAIVPAELHPSRDLARITYDPGDGTGEEDGVAALARGLEHLNFGWAMAGFAVRLPVIRSLVQLLVDAVGGGPRRIPRNPAVAALYVKS